MAAHMRGQSTPDIQNTTDPFSPDYVDPALSGRRARRRERRKSSGGFGWTLLYLVAAVVVAAVVWFLFGQGA